MKIVFLDIDGVLVNRRSMFVRKNNFPTGYPPCVAALNAITEATGAKLVVTSTWRVESSLEELREILQSWGIAAAVLDLTPMMPMRARAEEIRAWLGEHGEVTAFVILDDNHIGGGFEDRTVRTDEREGLSGKDLEKAIAILSSQDHLQLG